jgi:beta-glucanase (GH16 family)
MSFNRLAGLCLLCLLLQWGCAEDMTSPRATDNTTGAPSIRPDSYSLVWSDEFDTGTTPDSTRWSYDLGSPLIGGTVWGNSEQEHYTDSANNAYLSGGNLVIQAIHETPTGASPGVIASSARLKTDTSDFWNAMGSTPYGFYEIRAKLPCVAGAWPAIWLLGKNGNWPERGEIDIAEWFGRYSDQYTITSAIHNGAYSGGNLDNAPVSNPQTAQQRLSDLCTAFHRFQLHWTESQLVLGVDDVTTLTYRKLAGATSAEWPFDQPAYLILNVAVGGNLGGSVSVSDISNMTMRVDYVRVWKP